MVEFQNYAISHAKKTVLIVFFCCLFLSWQASVVFRVSPCIRCSCSVGVEVVLFLCFDLWMKCIHDVVLSFSCYVFRHCRNADDCSLAACLWDELF